MPGRPDALPAPAGALLPPDRELSVRATPVSRVLAIRCIPGAGGVGRCAGLNADDGTVAQLIGAIDDHRVTDLKAVADRDHVANGWTRSDGTYVNDRSGRARGIRVRLYDIHVIAGGPLLHSGAGYQDLIVQRLERQPDVDELLREQHALVVIEHGAQLQRARGGVDLVVGVGQRSVIQQGGEGAIVGGSHQLLAAVQPLHDLAQAVLGDGEQYRHRLQLRDHDDRGRIGADDVAEIDLAQPDASGDG